jgi:hypothetical protein
MSWVKRWRENGGTYFCADSLTLLPQVYGSCMNIFAPSSPMGFPSRLTDSRWWFLSMPTQIAQQAEEGRALFDNNKVLSVWFDKSDLPMSSPPCCPIEL